ncbi:hypothetical protein Tco_1557850, partial [Tanacetum coccineum]
MEHRLKDACKQADLISLKPFHTTAIIFKTSYENETALTLHMCKVVELSPDPIKSLPPLFGEVNADDTADKIDSSSTQATHLQYAEKLVVLVDSNKCLDASESAEEQGNQPNTVDVEK